MGPLYINTLYIHRERMFCCTVVQTGQSKHLLSFYDNWRRPQVLFHVWKGRVRWGGFCCNMKLDVRNILHTEPLMLLILKRWHFKIKSVGQMSVAVSECAGWVWPSHLSEARLWRLPHTCCFSSDNTGQTPAWKQQTTQVRPLSWTIHKQSRLHRHKRELFCWDIEGLEGDSHWN